jgi:hypothetical protein
LNQHIFYPSQSNCFAQMKYNKPVKNIELVIFCTSIFFKKKQDINILLFFY